MLNRLREVSPPDLVQVFEQRLEGPDHERDHRQDNQLLPGIADSEAGEE